MIALVTGANGFLGRELVRRLLRQQVAVRCLVRPSSDVAELHQHAGPAQRGQLEIHRGNLERLDRCADVLDGSDVVFHLAAEMRGAPAVLFAGNVINTRRLIEQACRRQVRRFVLVSSLAVYGTGGLPRHAVIDESCPLDPEPHRRDPYTFSKVAQEQVAWDAHEQHGLPVVVIRPGVIYGPGRDCITGRVGLRLGRFLLVMNGRRQLPYTYRDNCAQALVQAGLKPGLKTGSAFNIVDDHLPTPHQLLRACRAAGDAPWRLTLPGWAVQLLSRTCEWYHHWSEGQLPAVLTPYKSAAMWGPVAYSNAKAKAELGWQPEVDFAAGLEQTLRGARLEAVAS